MTDRQQAPSSLIAAFVAVEHEESSMRGVGGFWGALSLLALGALVTLGGCAQDEKPATAIAVAVKADPALSGLSTVQVRVYAGDAVLGSDMPLFEAKPQPASKLAAAVVLTPAGRDDELVIAVQGLDATGGVLVENHVRASFVSGRTLGVPVYLASSCAKATTECDAAKGLTCIGDSVQGVCGCSPIPVVTGMRVSDPASVTGSYQAKACPPEAVCQPEKGLPGSTCNLTSQCGCKTGERCDAVEQGGRFVAICQPEPGGTRASGQACEDPDQCAPGHVCAGNNPATCKHYCESDMDCGGAVGSCDSIRDRTGKQDIGFKACFQKCSANDQCQTGCCGAGGSCVSPDQCGGPPDDEIPECLPKTGDTSCTACAKASCCSERVACVNDTGCQGYVRCLDGCGANDTACSTRCEQANPRGAAIFDAFARCLQDDCSGAAACGG